MSKSEMKIITAFTGLTVIIPYDSIEYVEALDEDHRSVDVYMRDSKTHVTLLKEEAIEFWSDYKEYLELMSSAIQMIRE